jgi:hypothetical protein
MGNFEEFAGLKEIKGEYSKLAKEYEGEGFTIYIEPGFYTQMHYFEDFYLKEYSNIVDTVISIAKKYKKVIFTTDYDNPLVKVDGFVYRDIDDVLASVKMTYDNKCDKDSDWKD